MSPKCLWSWIKKERIVLTLSSLLNMFNYPSSARSFATIQYFKGNTPLCSAIKKFRAHHHPIHGWSVVTKKPYYSSVIRWKFLLLSPMKVITLQLTLKIYYDCSLNLVLDIQSTIFHHYCWHFKISSASHSNLKCLVMLDIIMDPQ